MRGKIAQEIMKGVVDKMTTTTNLQVEAKVEIVESRQNLSAALVADWLSFNADKSPATIRTYSKAVEFFFKWLATNNITNPNRADVIAYVNSLCATKKIATARLYTTAVKVFSKWLASAGLYFDFAAGVDTPKLDEESETHSRDALTLDEARAVLKSFSGKVDVKSLRDALIMRIMLNCGLRSLEITRLDATDIDRRHGKIYLSVWGKGRKGKTARVEISKTIYNMIQDYLNARGSKRVKGEPMFTSTANRNFGARLQTQTISRLAKKTFRAVGIDSSSIVCHSCRHFFASELLNQGVDIRTISKLMRHKNQAVTEVYLSDKKMRNDTSVLMLSDLLDVAVA